MKNRKKIITLILLIVFSIIVGGTESYAHLGEKHRGEEHYYYCGGHGAHLHNNGVCPYSEEEYNGRIENNWSRDSKSIIPKSSNKNNIRIDNTIGLSQLLTCAFISGGGYLGYRKLKK